MSILIQGMEMPQENSTINVLIYADGTVYTGHVNDSQYSAVSVPTPHGRLIDADKFKADYSMKNDCAECEKELRYSSRSCEYDRIYSKMDFCEWIDNAPTIIEAEGK